MRVLEFFLDLLFPPKCILCSRLLQHQETDLCKTCRLEAPTCSGRKKSISFAWIGLPFYYYEGTVRESLLRYKFGGVSIMQQRMAAAGCSNFRRLHGEFDLLTYVPVSTRAGFGAATTRFFFWPRQWGGSWELSRFRCCRRCGTMPRSLPSRARSNGTPTCWAPTGSASRSAWLAGGFYVR